jgi:hypothetical protein
MVRVDLSFFFFLPCPFVDVEHLLDIGNGGSVYRHPEKRAAGAIKDFLIPEGLE